MKKLFALIKMTASLAVEFVKTWPILSAVMAVLVIAFGNFAMVTVEKFPHVACSPCHVMDPYVVGYESEELLSHVHQKAGVECIDCHENGIEDKIQETVWYVTDDFDDPPYKRDFGNEMCTKCHDDLDRIKIKTDEGDGINPHDSHLGDLNCADCHKMHTKSKASCSECHDFDFLKRLPAEWDTSVHQSASI